MQLEIDCLWRRLCHERRRKTPSSSDPSFDNDGDESYRPRLRTPHSESFLYDKDCRHKCRNKSPSHKSLGSNAMSRALHQISKSPFTHRIEGGNFLSSLLSQHSLCIMAKQTLWNMLATSIRE